MGLEARIEGFDEVPYVALDEVGVDCHGGGGSFSGCGDYLSAGIGYFAGYPHTGDRGLACAVFDGPPGVINGGSWLREGCRGAPSSASQPGGRWPVRPCS